ncbi:hypothetical protein TrRE_jg8263 [Triparma retinervis]|uniref:ER membrane protein complex subunit 3 n=1 Tax=Triparma retinervis TaxID=2557542 RepID=A0A9W7FHQ6_9STRA|nr:hypothetical protein TrRE_jg8263 [Triparma retinervis]
MSTDSNLLLLSPSIRDWVVFPLLIITFLTGLLRTVTSTLLRSSKKIPPGDRQIRGVLARCGRLRAAGGFLAKDRWESRRRYWTSSDQEGPLRQGSKYLKEGEGGKGKAAAGPMANPAGAMEGMMGNASFMVQNMVMMQTIQHFFSGFVLLKVPFPLTKGFKGMFQRGVDLPTLDVSYVSSVSWRRASWGTARGRRRR